MRMHHIQDARAIAEKALGNGATVVRRGVVEWHAAGACHDPQLVTIHGRHSRQASPTVRTKRGTVGKRLHAAVDKFIVVDGVSQNPLWVDTHVPCRKCRACLRARSRKWSNRCAVEITRASRTWFGTMTLRPEEHYNALCRAVALGKSRGVEWDHLTAMEQFTRRNAAVAPEISKFLKRLRSETGAPVRIMLVAEPHKSGLPHYHLLVHETSETQFVRKEQLERQWQLGFSKWKLVNPGDAVKTARYVAKYLTKSNLARVRASIRYGEYDLSSEPKGREN